MPYYLADCLDDDKRSDEVKTFWSSPLADDLSDLGFEKQESYIISANTEEARDRLIAEFGLKTVDDKGDKIVVPWDPKAIYAPGDVLIIGSLSDGPTHWIYCTFE